MTRQPQEEVGCDELSHFLAPFECQEPLVPEPIERLGRSMSRALAPGDLKDEFKDSAGSVRPRSQCSQPVG